VSKEIELKGLSLEEKLGQLLMVGIPGVQISAGIEELIRDYRLGGIILFERNYHDPQQLASLCSGLQSLAAKNPAPIPLFIAVDQEGGRVVRFKRGFTIPPAPAELGNQGSPELVYEIFSRLGEELKAAGINMDLAPVLDVNTNISNPVIGNRAFGSDPELVTDLGLTVISALQDKGIIAVGKHFPGHGDTSLDSHTHLPHVTHSLSRLDAVELSPFRGAVKAGLGAIMTAHVVYDMIDPDYPATLSEKIVDQILRKNIGFNGVVLSDDFDMGALVNNYDLETAAVRAIQSGIDLLLVCHHKGHQNRVYRGLLRAAQEGLLTEACLDRALTRILKLKRKFSLF
jgi:beta-N-acetylhexosaminidase